MPSYKLYYFNSRGRAEISRWLFCQAGVEYEDVRLTGDEWARKKPEFPFHQMPVLEVTDDAGNTAVIAQSHSIQRFQAREFGLDGKTKFNAARADMLWEHLHDSMMKLPWTEKDPEKQKQLMKEAVEGPIGKDFELLEKFVQDNGYLVGDDVTVADLGFTVCCEWFLNQYPNALDKTPKLKALSDKVRGLPKIKAWIAKRPVTHVPNIVIDV